jgi:hypothetical protein
VRTRDRWLTGAGGAVLAVVVGCGIVAATSEQPHVQPQYGTSTYDDDAEVETYDQSVCDAIDAQAGVNERLARDGVADSYAAEYDSLRESSGCP